ncbi:hypothetical protein [uncultured Ruminococcus sp.]|jgi:hypothetical protein|uniref:hypothetical protein n=1 Tax=uncultured Ruminococcus sp. TaxID=165186 RepID=UPI000EE168A1|nr:hypothetical protein [uncultured Ruminococcus sp.]HCJ40838.1 hypothetical protein [Ruminococcus sp.]
MEEFRKKVHKRVVIDSLICGNAILLYMALLFFTKGASEFGKGISIGLFCGFEIVAVYTLAKNFTALHNDDRLKEMYINENDERNLAIAKETSQKSSLITVILTALAAVAAGFFDVKICLTLVAALLLSAVVNIIVNIYFNKRM